MVEVLGVLMLAHIVEGIIAMVAAGLGASLTPDVFPTPLPPVAPFHSFLIVKKQPSGIQSGTGSRGMAFQ